MITMTHNASDLFVVRPRRALTGNPPWADLIINSNKKLNVASGRGAGLYAIHFHGALLYVGKFCGTRSDPFAGSVCDTRWSKHIGTLTLRDRRISLSEGRCRQFIGSVDAPLVDLVNSLQTSTIQLQRGRATSMNRALFAAEHWAVFSQIANASDLNGFDITYTQIEAAVGIDPARIRSIVSVAERTAINRLLPRCNGGVRLDCSGNANMSEVAAALEQAIYLAGGGQPPGLLLTPVLIGENIDDDEPLDMTLGVALGGGSESAEDSDVETHEEQFWSRIENEPEARAAVNLLVEALDNLVDADYHFSGTNEADLRVHSLTRSGSRFNVACFAWQPKLRRFISEIGLSAEKCVELGASSAKSNYNLNP